MGTPRFLLKPQAVRYLSKHKSFKACQKELLETKDEFSFIIYPSGGFRYSKFMTIMPKTSGFLQGIFLFFIQKKSL